MKREYRQPTRSEWERITSARLIVRRVLRRTTLTRHRDERLKAPKAGGG